MVVCVGENINVMSKTIGPAMKERKADPIVEMAKHEEKVGIDYLDLNIGPSRKAGQEVMDWIVKLVQGVVKKPMSLDTTIPTPWGGA
jgi:cobalamin-dependent methionine synthase I